MLLLLLPSIAQAGPFDEVGVSAQYNAMANIQWTGGDGSRRAALQASARRKFATYGVGFGRLLNDNTNPATAWEGYGQVRLSPAMGKVWRPSVAWELGVTGALDGLEENRRPSRPRYETPVYGIARADPLAVRLGPVSLSALEVGMGTSVLRPGKVLRIDLTVVQVGVWR